MRDQRRLTFMQCRSLPFTTGRLAVPFAFALTLALLLPASGPVTAQGVRPASVAGQGHTLEDFFTAALNFSPSLRIAEERMNVGASRRRSASDRKCH